MQKCTLRPRVSSPTRIENPNLPPLNLYPKKCGSMRKGLSANHQQTATPSPTLGDGTLTKMNHSNTTAVASPVVKVAPF